MQKVNICHNIKYTQVCIAVNKKVKEYRQLCRTGKIAAKLACKRYKKSPHLFTEPPRSPEDVGIMYQGWIEREQTHYILVRVIELPKRGKRFILVYGDTDDTTIKTGTGPFSTFDKAANWFINGGR